MGMGHNNIIEEEEEGSGDKKIHIEGKKQIIAKRLNTYKRAAEYLKMVSEWHISIDVICIDQMRGARTVDDKCCRHFNCGPPLNYF